MGFYLRKSFRAGPVRFNLSKSGFGTSVGVKGARAGVTSTGRSYVHAGRGGLYYRKYSGSTTSSAAKGGGPSASPAVELEADTGVTYGSLTSKTAPAIEDELLRPRSPRYFYIPAFAFLLLLVNPMIGLAAFFLWPVALLRSSARQTRARRLGELLRQDFLEPDRMSSADRDRLAAALRDPRIRPEDRAYFQKRQYVEFLRLIMSDSRVSPDELAALDRAEGICDQSDDFYKRAKLEAYRRVYLEAVSDHDLTEAEEKTLEHIRSALALEPDELAEETAMLDQLRELRAVRSGDLPVVATDARLQKGETCFFESEARLLKSKIVRSYQSQGQRHKVRGLVVDREGRLLITNKRILLVHSGTTSVPIPRILDLEIDCDRQVLAITKDGASKPVLFTTPDALRAGTILATLTNA